MKTLSLAFVLGFGATAYAGWPSDAGDNVPVADYDYSATPSVVSDGLGGVFVVFPHSGAGVPRTLQGEHFDSQANRLWGTPNADGGSIGKDLLGISLGTTTYFSKALAISDDDGGFIAGYVPGDGTYTLSLQRFDKDGSPVWAPTGTKGGVELLASPSSEQSFWIVRDLLGGALISYVASAGNIYGQRVDSSGAITYGSGVLFSGGQSPSLSYAGQVESADGLGGMYYLWPTSGSASSDPYLAHMASDGGVLFTVTSVAPNQAPFGQWSIAGLPGGAGCWASWSGSTTSSLYLQRFLADGGAAFLDAGAVGGLLIAGDSATYPEPTMILDGAGGVVVVWFDVTAGVNVLYAQRYASDGSTVWGAQPIAVSSAATTPATESSYLRSFRIIPTLDNNIAVFWATTTSGIYAEKIAMNTGARLWGPLSGGVQVSSVPATPSYWWIDAVFAEDDSAYVTYVDSQNRVFLKHVLADGTLGTTVPDAGPPDAGPPDAGPLDGGPLDAGSVDAGFDGGPDAGPDAGPDSGVIIIGNDGGINGSDDGGEEGTPVPAPAALAAVPPGASPLRKKHFGSSVWPSRVDALAELARPRPSLLAGGCAGGEPNGVAGLTRSARDALVVLPP